MTTASPLAEGAVIGGKYRLTAPLAKGGMGAVWVAEHVELGVLVAVKLMDPACASSPTMRARFATEARAAAGLRNRHIVHVQDYGVEGDTPYLVMELLHGEDLGARLRRVGRLSLAETAALLAQVARGLRGAHEAGFVHRDLKPGNIFLACVDDEELVKILDFGVVKDRGAQFGGETTQTGEVVGSPQYMSPEQVRSLRDLDARSDVWSLGAIVFRCLTGRRAFDGPTVGAVIGQILADPLPVATEIAPDLPPEVDALFARALARDRDARFRSVGDLSAALSALAGVRADPTSSFPRPSQAALATVPPLPALPLPAIEARLEEPPPTSPAPSEAPTAASASLSTAGAPLAAGPARLRVLAAAAGLAVAAALFLALGSRSASPPAPSPAASTAPAISAPPSARAAPSASADPPPASPTTTASAASSASAAPRAPAPAPRPWPPASASARPPGPPPLPPFGI